MVALPATNQNIQSLTEFINLGLVSGTALVGEYNHANYKSYSITMMNNKFNINSISPHLFWDVNPINLDAEKNKKLIIARVLDYGLFSDWLYIKNYYGLDVITETAVTIRDLDLKSMAFISTLSNIPYKHFKCYISIQSTSKHWNF